MPLNSKISAFHSFIVIVSSRNTLLEAMTASGDTKRATGETLCLTLNKDYCKCK